MKYNIFDFDQEIAISLIKEEVDEKGKSIIYKLDVVDLLLLHTIADYMNRKSIEKMIINDKIYFWISYNIIISDLPIIDIKKQALSDRLNKLAKLNLLEKEIVRNSQGTYSCFRIGAEYEILKYKGGCSKLQKGEVLDYEPKDYTNNNYSTNNNKEDTSVSKKDEIDYAYIKEQWKIICPMLASIRDLNPKRKKAIANTLKNNNANVDDMIKCFKIIASSEFCKGDNKQAWKATFDWIINDTKSCFNRLLEGEFSKNRYEHELYEKIINGNTNIINKEENNKNNNIVINGQIYR